MNKKRPGYNRDVSWYDDSIYPSDKTNRKRYKRPDHLDIYCPNYEDFVYYPKEGDYGDYRYIKEYPQYQNYNSVSQSCYQRLSNPYRKFYSNNKRNYYPNQYRDYKSTHKKPANPPKEVPIGKEKPTEKPNIADDSEDTNISDAETVRLDSGDEYDDKKLISNDLKLPEYSLTIASNTKTVTIESKAANKDSRLDKNKSGIKSCNFLSETKNHPTKAPETEEFQNNMARRDEKKGPLIKKDNIIGLRLIKVESQKCINTEVPKTVGQTEMKYLRNKNPSVIVASKGDHCQTKTAEDSTKLHQTNVAPKRIEQTETTPSVDNVILLNRNGYRKYDHSKKQDEIKPATKASEGKVVTKTSELTERTPLTVSNGSDLHRKDYQTKKQDADKNVEADRKSSKVKETNQNIGSQIPTSADIRIVQYSDAANKETDKKIDQRNSHNSINNRDVETIDNKKAKGANDGVAKLDGRRCSKSGNNTKETETLIEGDSTANEEISQNTSKKPSKRKGRSKSVCAIASNFVSYEDIKKMDNIMTSLIDDQLDPLHDDEELCKITWSPESETKIPEPKPKSSRSRMRGKSCILFDRNGRDTPHFSGAQSLAAKDVLCFTDFRVTRSISKDWLLSAGLEDRQRKCRTPAVTENKKPERVSRKRQTANASEVPVKKPSLFSEGANEAAPRKEWRVVPIELSFTPRYEDVEPVTSYDSVTCVASNNRDPRRKGRISMNGRDLILYNSLVKESAKEEGNKNGEIKTSMSKKICGRRKSIAHGCDSDADFVSNKQSTKEEGNKDSERKTDMPKKICDRRKTISHGYDSDLDFVPNKQNTKKEGNKVGERKTNMPMKISGRRKTITTHGYDNDPDYVPNKQSTKEEGNKDGERKTDMPKKVCGRSHGYDSDPDYDPNKQSTKEEGNKYGERKTDMPKKICDRKKTIAHGCDSDANFVPNKQSTKEEGNKDGERKADMPKKISDRRKSLARKCDIDPESVPPQKIEISSRLISQQSSVSNATTGVSCVVSDKGGSKNIREPSTDKSIKSKPVESTTMSSIVQTNSEPDKKVNALKRRKSIGERVNSNVNSLITESAKGDRKKDGEINTSMPKKICDRRKTAAHGYDIYPNCVPPQKIEIPLRLNAQTCLNKDAPSGKPCITTDKRTSKSIREPPTEKSIKIKPVESTRSSIVQKKSEPNEKTNAPKRRKSTERVHSNVSKRDSSSKDMPLLGDNTTGDLIVDAKSKKIDLIDANIKHYRTSVLEPSFQSKSAAYLNIEKPQICSASPFIEPPSTLNIHKTEATTTTSISEQVKNTDVSFSKLKSDTSMAKQFEDSVVLSAKSNAATTSVSEQVKNSYVSFSRSNACTSMPEQVPNSDAKQNASTSVSEKATNSNVLLSRRNTITYMSDQVQNSNTTAPKQENNSSIPFSRPNVVNILETSSLTPNQIMTMQAQLPQIFSDLATSLFMIKCLQHCRNTQIVFFDVLPLSDAVTNERNVFNAHYNERISCWSGKICTVCNKMHTDVLDVREFLNNLFVAVRKVIPKLSIIEYITLMKSALADNYCTSTNYVGRLKLYIMGKVNQSSRADHLERVVNNTLANATPTTTPQTTNVIPAVLQPGGACTSQNQTPVGATVRQTVGNTQSHARAATLSTLPAAPIMLPSQIDQLKSQIFAFKQAEIQSSSKPRASSKEKKNRKKCRDLSQLTQQLQQEHPSNDLISNKASFALGCLANKSQPNLTPKNVSCGVNCPKPVPPPLSHPQNVSYLSNFLAPCSGSTNSSVAPLANLGQKETPRYYSQIRDRPTNNIVYPVITNAIASENNNFVNPPNKEVFRFGKTQMIRSQTKQPHKSVNKSGAAAVSHESVVRVANNNNAISPVMNRSSVAANVQYVAEVESHGSGARLANNGNTISYVMNRSSLAANIQYEAEVDSHGSGARLANNGNAISPVMNRFSLAANIQNVAEAENHGTSARLANNGNAISTVMNRCSLAVNGHNVAEAEIHGSSARLANNNNAISPVTGDVNVTSPVLNRKSLTAHVRDLAAAESCKSVVKFANKDNVTSSTTNRSSLTANVQNVAKDGRRGSVVKSANNDSVTSPTMNCTSSVIDLTLEDGTAEFVDLENYFNYNNSGGPSGPVEMKEDDVEETPSKRRKISDSIDDDPIPPRTSSIDSGMDSPGQVETTTLSTFENRVCLCGESAIYVCPCRQVMYCSRTCQIDDWQDHRKTIAH